MRNPKDENGRRVWGFCSRTSGAFCCPREAPHSERHRPGKHVPHTFQDLLDPRAAQKNAENVFLGFGSVRGAGGLEFGAMAAIVKRFPRSGAARLLRNPACASSGASLGLSSSGSEDVPNGSTIPPRGAKLGDSEALVSNIGCLRALQLVKFVELDGASVSNGSYNAGSAFAVQLASSGVRRFAAVASVGEGDLTNGEADDLVQIEDARESGEGESSQVDDGLAMFTSASSLANVTGDDVMKYITFSEEDVLKYFGEGLPRGIVKEFEVTKANSLMIRPKVLQLCNFLERHVTGKNAFELPAEDVNVTKPKKHILLDGPEGSGKSVALAMLVQWARARGWLVFYIPSGKGWTHGSLYYRNEETGLVETPVTAQMALEGFLKSHSELLDTLPCNIADPVPLGEGAGVARVRGPQEFTLPEGATLKQLVEKGLSMSHAGVGTVVRLRKELSLVKDVPVLIAIDDYNSWFVFTEYGVKAKKPIHAHQLEMVRAFRPIAGSKEMMVTAFSHSNAVGKLPLHLPDVPKGVRFDFPRYSPVEASTALQYYHSRELTVQEPGDADVIRLYYLTGGNGKEIRNLSRFL